MSGIWLELIPRGIAPRKFVSNRQLREEYNPITNHSTFINNNEISFLLNQTAKVTGIEVWTTPTAGVLIANVVIAPCEMIVGSTLTFAHGAIVIKGNEIRSVIEKPIQQLTWYDSNHWRHTTKLRRIRIDS